MPAREARPGDVDQMTELADLTRRVQEGFAPVFWRPAPDAVDVHRAWLAELVADPAVGSFVHVVDGEVDADVDGFIVVTTTTAPPVYDPGGMSSVIDDFVVSSPELWSTAGRSLLDSATAWARARGAVQVVVVSGAYDEPQRAVLRAAGLSVVSEWFTSPLRPGQGAR